MGKEQLKQLCDMIGNLTEQIKRYEIKITSTHAIAAKAYFGCCGKDDYDQIRAELIAMGLFPCTKDYILPGYEQISVTEARTQIIDWSDQIILFCGTNITRLKDQCEKLEEHIKN